MTQAPTTTLTPRARLEHLVLVARDRAARGNATADDWRAIAEIDEERARHELAIYLRRAQPVLGDGGNPYQKRRGAVGAVTGFILGSLLVVLAWQFLVPWLQDAWRDIDYGPGIATAITYIAPILLPLGAYIGSRWDRRQQATAQEAEEPITFDPDAGFEDLVRRFCQAQKRGKARVY